MKIVVLHGSPKGEVSVTMQYVRYLKQHFTQHEFVTFPVAQRIKILEQNPDLFEEIIDQVRGADGVIWSFPLYVMTVCSQYQRFIELIHERYSEDAFEGKYCVSLSTSIHFYDHTAHNYIRAIAEDMGMIYVASFPAEMQDLLNEEKRSDLISFGDMFFRAIEEKRHFPRAFEPVSRSAFLYEPSPTRRKISLNGKKAVVLHDLREGDSNLENMIERFANSLEGDIEIRNLHEEDIRGGCLGCCKCGYDNTCTWEEKDGFVDLYNNILMKADILIFAGTIRYRHFSSMWKMFLDRSFFNTHQPWFKGQQLVYLISGPLRQNENLREVLYALSEVFESNLAGIVTDECETSEELDRLIDDLAARTVEASVKEISGQKTFRGVGGMKVFRDDVWGRLRFVFQADHRYYKEHGVYDFPQYNWKVRALNVFMIPLLYIPAVRKKIFADLPHHMIRPYQKLFENKKK